MAAVVFTSDKAKLRDKVAEAIAAIEAATPERGRDAYDGSLHYLRKLARQLDKELAAG